ncbi:MULTISPECIES: hypothetical protein [unclassified Clostridium]|uniref:Uncharacterized protein n=1 Tax=Clostridium botulinum (strain Eklund 17B / Type B) TaxID=935198 RepID=B2TKU7_CLOBB|nr:MULTISPECIES: hypothetical protein [unclassified Clostridium]ACD24779.1 hypothetical protein CLL_A1633 [Clostridium botulinum B str. Eklund 17B (NRP)]MBN1045266.1 hypothetical protein [Clostridium botulinum]MBY6974562.1 hypothetical protein [Clostridium botulinum]MBY6999547.1 hypothetical protein [Clostridium botulinum]MCR1275226.1 hypothetical protein [Clostridium botulinum]
MQIKIVNIVVTIFFFLLFNDECRTCSAYFPNSKWKKYITIKNNSFADILIAKSISRDKFVHSFDYNKMSIVGLISYICIGPINLFALIVGILKSVSQENNKYLIDLYILSIGLVGVLCIIFIIVILINTKKCKNR